MEIRYRKILGSLIILCLIYIAISPLKSDEYTLLRSGSNDEGVNYQTSEIIDKNGKVVHQWVTHFTYSNQEFDNTDHQLLKFFPNGDVIVLTYQKGLARIDLNSNVIWNIEGNFHHDTQITDDKIYTLMWKNRYIESNNETLPIMDEILVTLDYHGNILKEKSLYQIFKKLIPDEVYENISEYIQHENLSDLIKEKPNDFYLKSNLPWDVLHMNSLTLIEEDTDIFKKGQFLVSMRTINTIAVFDPNLNEIIWGYSGDLIRQHNPTLLANGNILVFDNGGKVEYPISTTNYLTKERNEQERLFTRIIEIEPKTKNIVWEYTSEIPEEFYSKIMGSSQRLDNGNTLITDAFNGKVFEINSRKKIVWNYKAPLENMSFYRGYRLNKNEVNIINDFIHR